MRSRLRMEAPYKRRDGHIGARASVAILESSHPQTYSFDTHGMTSQQVADEAARLETYHAAKAERLERFRRLHGMVVARGYTIVDCTILDAGVTLYVDVRPNATGFPLRHAYQSIGAVPTNDAILKIVAEALPDAGTIDDAHAEFVAKVEARRG